MTVKISAAAAIAACNTLVDMVDAGAGAAGSLEIYAGTQPANVDTAINTQTKLVDFVLPNPCFGPAVDTTAAAVATANAVATVQAIADGDATFFRVYDTDGTALWDGTVTAANGGGDLELSATSIITGIDVTVVSFTANMAKA